MYQNKNFLKMRSSVQSTRSKPNKDRKDLMYSTINPKYYFPNTKKINTDVFKTLNEKNFKQV